MEIELEKTFLVKKLPENLESCKAVEILDMYIPASVEHPVLRLRKRGDIMELTKKFPLDGKDSSEQAEHTISLSELEYEDILKIGGKNLRKIRYYYNIGKTTAEIDVYKDDLEGLVVADFEFNSREDKDGFEMPEFCLADVTQEEWIAAGILAGKAYPDIQPVLEKYGYKKLIIQKSQVNIMLT